MDCCLISTNHLSESLWFRDDEDFKVGMNYVALVVGSTGVRMLSFILMSNHVHFVVECRIKEAEEFINIFKRRYSQYFSRKYGSRKLLKRNSIDIRTVPFEKESVERAIAYVQMNSVAANICLSSTQYPWGTGDCFFSGAEHKGISARSLSAEAKRRITHSHDIVPDHYVFNEDYILPSSYVEVDFVEALFRTPKRMHYFLVNSSKAKNVHSMAEAHLPSFRDQSLLAIIPDLCRSLFNSTTPEALSDGNKSILIKEISRRFSADISQICRVMGMERAKVINLLEAF